MGIYTQAIQQLYVAYFNRPADIGGLAYWESVVAGQNGSTALVSAEFARSAEYKAAYQGKSNAEIVNQVYLNLFGRAAEESGKAYWANALDKGYTTIDDAVTMVAKGAQGSDLVAYNAKVSGAAAFTQLLPTDPGVVVYAGSAGIAEAKDYISAITSAATLALATRNDNLLASLAAVKSASVAPVTVSLTTAVDTIAPGKALPLDGNDTFNAVSVGGSQSINAHDQINGGLGKNTLNISSTNSLALIVPQDVTISNIQSANLSAKNTVSVDTSGWTGLRKLNVSSMGGDTINAASNTAIVLTDSQLGNGMVDINGGSDVTLNLSKVTNNSIVSVGSQLAPTGAVLVNNQISGAANQITIKGGSSVTVKSTLVAGADGSFGGKVTVNGTANTASVDISNVNPDAKSGAPGIAASVIINDANFGTTQAGTIQNVTVKTSFATTINDTGLKSLTLAGGGTVQINNAGLTHPDSTTLALSLQNDARVGGNFLALSDQAVYTKLNVTMLPGGAGYVFLTPDLHAVTELAIGGEGDLSLISADKGLGALQSISLSGKTSLSVDLQNTQVSSVDAARVLEGSGLTSLMLDASKTSFAGGAETDYITLGAALPTKAINGAAGVDLLTMSADLAGRISQDASAARLISNFETLILKGGGAQSIDLATMGGFHQVWTQGGEGQILNNFANDGILSLQGSGVSYTLANTAFARSSNDHLTVFMNNNERVATNFASSGLTINQVESINLYSGDLTKGHADNTLNSLTLNADAAQRVTVYGAGGINLNLTAGALQEFRGDDVDAGLLNLTLSGLKADARVIANLVSSNVIDLTGVNKAVTYTGGTGADTLTVATGAHKLTLGGGTDKVIFAAPNASLSSFTTILDPHVGLALSLPDVSGSATFNDAKLVLSNGTLQTYANAAVAQAGSNGNIGAIGWFQLGGDTYVVETRHDGSSTPTFVNGTDLIVKLTGLIDLSHADVIDGNTLVLV